MMRNTMKKYKHHISERLTGGNLEIAGTLVKCVSSNIRRLDIPWDSFQVIPGKGKEGNLVLVEVISESGSRKYLENQQGVNQRLYKGDKFVGVLANRHSGTEESGDVPTEGLDIYEGLELHLLSTSGIIGIITGIPVTMVQKPLRLKALGLVATKKGKLVELLELSGYHHKTLNSSAPIIIVCGTSSEIGKTTTSTSLIRAFCAKGMRVAGTKIAGTGNMQDVFSLRDAGAVIWLEFPDVGLPSTYTNPERFTKGTYTLFNYINDAKPDIIVAEAGGDPIEANIPAFLADLTLMQYVKAFVIVAGDVMGMMGTVSYLQQFAPDIPIFLADPKDRNPYETRKRVHVVLPGLPMFNSLNPMEVKGIIEQILNRNH